MRLGFTLAEVLITLGIIGVVAAMTLPVLINDYKAKSLSEQLKVSYSLLSQGYAKMLADDETTDFRTSSYASMLEDENLSEEDEIKLMGKYFKVTVAVPYAQQVKEGWPAGNTKYSGATCEKWVGKGSTWYLKGRKQCEGLRQNVYRLSNGALVRSGFFMYYYPNKDNSGHLKQPIAQLTVDVNGEKGPNTFGEDVFMFVVGQDGKLYPMNGTDFAYYMEAAFNKNFNNVYYLRSGTDTCKTGDGKTCTAAVLEHNFKINY